MVVTIKTKIGVGDIGVLRFVNLDTAVAYWRHFQPAPAHPPVLPMSYCASRDLESLKGSRGRRLTRQCNVDSTFKDFPNDSALRRCSFLWPEQ